jgi:hypothetical protein
MKNELPRHGALAVDGCRDYVRVIGDQEDWAQCTKWGQVPFFDFLKGVKPHFSMEEKGLDPVSFSMNKKSRPESIRDGRELS